MSQSADLKSPALTAGHSKETPIYETNPREDEENPRYIASRQVGAIIEKLPDTPVEEVPRYVATQGDKDGDSSDSTAATKGSSS